MRAPDHGRMLPWRFKVIRGAAHGPFCRTTGRAPRWRTIRPRRSDSWRSFAVDRCMRRWSSQSARGYRDNPKVPEIEQTARGRRCG